jgi:DNA-binding response OmpR family regulator
MSMKVLIADPDWRFSTQATKYLESHAHLVVQQTQTEQISEVVRNWRPDLVIVSEELTEEGLLESIQETPDRPAVLLIGWMDRYDRVWRAWQRGGDELMMKPIFRDKDFHNAIVAALENAAAGTRQAELAASA